jgi:hypothetical protein
MKVGARIEICRAVCVWSVALAALLLAADAPGASAGGRPQSTELISHAVDGGLPNGPSTSAVISSDRRYARLIAFQSEASNLVLGDTNGRSDVFVVRRAGAIANDGAPWRIGATVLASRGRDGRAANGPSFAPAVSGSFSAPAACVTFLSAATNLVRGDTNHQVDAFLFRPATGHLRRISLPGGRQANAPATAAVVSGDCTRVAFVIAGTLYVSVHGDRARPVRAPGPLTDPAFSTGKGSDLVFAGPAGVYLSRMATKSPHLIVPGGQDPAFNDIKRQVVTYEQVVDGRSQVFARDLGQPARLLSGTSTIVTPSSTITGTGWWPGQADSRDPVIGNSGYYVAFESDASLDTTSSRLALDSNKRPDVYLYTDVRKMTLLESSMEKGHPLPGGGQHPSMSFYANYILFESPAPLGLFDGPPQIYMRWLGPV